MLVWIGIIPPKRIFNEIKKIQKEISKKYDTYHETKSKLGPRITIIVQDDVDKNNITEVLGAFEEICKEMKKINIKIRGVGSFYKNKVVYLKVIKSKRINELYKKTSKRLRKTGKTRVHGSYTPHITIAVKDITKGKIKQAKKELKKKKISYDFSVNRLYIAKAKPGGKAKIYKSFKLKA